ncbi:MAG TPA: GNAT family N-acetyltransferase [Chitinophagaceae bacterium]|nr:GNAT family N-acetyltransferase [Chitinophagaceae bacterium]
MIEIIDYEDRYHEDFRQLNLEWLEKYQLIEEHDFEVLNNPLEIIAGGGCIFLARLNKAIIGTAALVKMTEGIYELVKMTVTPHMRGAGIGKILIEHCIEKAKQLNAEKIILYSSTKLQTAVMMYEKYGFKHIPLINSPFITADIKMQLSL